MQAQPNRPGFSLPVFILSVLSVIILLPVALIFMVGIFIYALITKRRLKREFSRYFNNQAAQGDDDQSGQGRTIDQK